MSDTHVTPDALPEVHPQVEKVIERGPHHSFFQIVKLLGCLHPDAPTPGHGGPAHEEVFRFRPHLSMAFATSDVEQVGFRHAHDETPDRYFVDVNFMGLYGPSSPMPSHFTEELLWAGTDAQTLRDFYDVFHHRLISFTYRAWEKYRYHAQMRVDSRDAFTKRLLCLVGMGTPGVGEAAGLDPVIMLRSAGAFMERPRSAAGLACALRATFDGVPFEVESCVERQVRLSPDQQFKLGDPNAGLGSGTCVGEFIRDRTGGFRVVAGPVGIDEFRGFMPGGEHFDRLVRMTRLYTTGLLAFDVKVRLDADSVPPLSLSPDAGLALGRMSWLTPGGQVEGEVILDPEDGPTAWGRPGKSNRAGTSNPAHDVGASALES